MSNPCSILLGSGTTYSSGGSNLRITSPRNRKASIDLSTVERAGTGIERYARPQPTEPGNSSPCWRSNRLDLRTRDGHKSDLTVTDIVTELAPQSEPTPGSTGLLNSQLQACVTVPAMATTNSKEKRIDPELSFQLPLVVTMACP